MGRFPIKTVGNIPQCRIQKHVVFSFPNSYFLSMNLVVLDLTIQETLYDSFATFISASTVQPGIANSARLKELICEKDTKVETTQNLIPEEC